MGRIFLGLCMCGAWGCFDEFNRLEERILSAVSQEIHSIQMALRDKSFETRLINRRIHVSPDTGLCEWHFFCRVGLFLFGNCWYVLGVLWNYDVLLVHR